MRKTPKSAPRLAGALALGWIVLATLALAPAGMASADALARLADAVTCPECDPGRNCPVSAPGGPYTGLVGVPLDFDGTASSDPDGEPLAFAWDFDTSDGIGEDALGPTPVHAYERPGRYAVLLTVSSGNELEFRCSNSSITTAEIGAICAASVVKGNDAIHLGSGGAAWFASIQPASGCYANTDVILSSFVLRYEEKQIQASAVKSAIGDKDGDGIEEICVSFSKSDLKALFAGTRIGNGHRRISVTIAANLAT
ncbi:MAG TPA: PKD domain-containing protein, partial [Candidatus Eisenbacteria bacterium]|nr:PKD domain-containing protein [Candidatus Eisenbacteria bacterium]